MTKAFFNPGPVYITDHDFAKSERERESFFYLSSSLGLVSIEIFTSSLCNLCSLFYTDHFLAIVEILFTKQVFFFFFSCLQKISLVYPSSM